MAKLWGVELTFKPEVFGKLSRDEQLFMLKNLTEFPPYIKMAFMASPEEFLRLVFRGPVKVSSNCPCRTIFHDWTVNVTRDPENINFCQSAAQAEEIFKQTNPCRYYNFSERSMEQLINKSCYDYHSYLNFESSVCNYVKQVSLHPEEDIWNSEIEKKFYRSMLNFVYAKTCELKRVYRISRTVWAMIDAQDENNLYNYPDMGLDTVFTERVDFVLKKFYTTMSAVIASETGPDYEQIRIFAACLYLYEKSFEIDTYRMERTLTMFINSDIDEVNEIRASFDEKTALKEIDYNK